MSKSNYVLKNEKNDDIEENVKAELNNIYQLLSDKYKSKNRYGILSDIKCLITKLSLLENDSDLLD